MTFLLLNDAIMLVETLRDVCLCKLSPPASNPAVPVELPPSGSVHAAGGNDMTRRTQSTQALIPNQFQSQITQDPSGSQSALIMSHRQDNCLPSSQPNISSDLPVEFSVPVYQSRRNTSVSSANPGMHAYHSTPLDLHQSPLCVANQPSSLSSPFCPQASTQPDLYSIRPSVANMDIDSAARDSTNSRLDLSASRLAGASHAIESPVTNAAASSRKESLANAAITTDASIDATTATRPSTLMESLYEACRLDRLTQDELEKLVAHVVREDGFSELVSPSRSIYTMIALRNGYGYLPLA